MSNIGRPTPVVLQNDFVSSASTKDLRTVLEDVLRWKISISGPKLLLSDIWCKLHHKDGSPYRFKLFKSRLASVLQNNLIENKSYSDRHGRPGFILQQTLNGHADFTPQQSLRARGIRVTPP